MSSEYYIIQTGGRARAAFKAHAKTRATKQVGNVHHRFSLDGSLAIVKVEDGTSIGDLGRSRGPLTPEQARQFIQDNLAAWELPL